MSFTYDESEVSNWKGIDMMTLTKENGKSPGDFGSHGRKTSDD